MQFGIALYDALVGANVPASKALPLVQAMDKELIERLASKEQLLAVELRLGERTSAVDETLTLISQRSEQRIRALDERLLLINEGLERRLRSLDERLTATLSSGQESFTREMAQRSDRWLVGLGAFLVAMVGVLALLKAVH